MNPADERNFASSGPKAMSGDGDGDEDGARSASSGASPIAQTATTASAPVAPTLHQAVRAAGGANEIVQAFQTRHLPKSIIVPEIEGEMQMLRPVRLEDLQAMDDLDAFAHSSMITGYSQKAERAIVGTWVRDSVAWSMGDVDVQSAIEARGFERTIGWTMMTRLDRSVDPSELRPIGMIFLTAIDAWSRDARLQVILGRDFRSRGYSRDAMPRVMTFAFGPVESDDGLGLHRVSTFVPGTNQRSLSVYQSIGFTLDGVLRDKLWDDENDEYQDLNVLSTLADEYDPIRALDAWGMRILPGNPGIKEAMAAHGHSVELQKHADLLNDHSMGSFKTPEDFHDSRATAGEPEYRAPLNPRDAGKQAPSPAQASKAQKRKKNKDRGGAPADPARSDASEPQQAENADGVTRPRSKRAWWRRWLRSDAQAGERKAKVSQKSEGEGRRRPSKGDSPSSR